MDTRFQQSHDVGSSVAIATVKLKSSTRCSMAGVWLAPTCPQKNNNVNCSSLRAPCYFPDFPGSSVVLLSLCISASIKQSTQNTLQRVSIFFTTLTAATSNPYNFWQARASIVPPQLRSTPRTTSRRWHPKIRMKNRSSLQILTPKE